MRNLKENKIINKVLILGIIILSILSINCISFADDTIQTDNEVAKVWGSTEEKMPQNSIAGSTGMFPQYYIGTSRRLVNLPSSRLSWARQGSWTSNMEGNIVYCAEHGAYVRYGNYDPDKHYFKAGTTIIQKKGIDTPGTSADTSHNKIYSAIKEYATEKAKGIYHHTGNDEYSLNPETSEKTVLITENYSPFEGDAIAYFIGTGSDKIPKAYDNVYVLDPGQEGQSLLMNNAKTQMENRMRTINEQIGAAIWPSRYSSDIDNPNYGGNTIDATNGPEYVVLETAVTANDRYTTKGSGSYANDQKAYILTSLENVYGEKGEYGQKYSLNNMQSAYWKSLGQNSRGDDNGLYENATKYAEFVASGFNASIDTSLTQVIADRGNQQYIVGPFTLNYPDYTAEDISYVKSLSINNGSLIYDETHKDFEIIFEKGGTEVPGANGMKKHYPKSGEKFFIKFSASSIGYGTSVNLSAQFEYISGTNIDFTQLDTLADIWKYYGYWELSGEQAMDHNTLTITAKCLEYNHYEKGQGTYHYLYDDNGYPIYDSDGEHAKEEDTKTAYYNQYTEIDSFTFELYQPYIKQGKEPEQSGLSAQTLTIAQNGQRSYKIESRDVTIDLSMELGGYTWEDAKGGKESASNGVYGGEDEGDRRIPNMQVTLYQDGGSEVGSTRTDGNGQYRFSGLNAMYQYYVKFTYNGQYYQPVNFESSSTWGGSNWYVNSNAKDRVSERKEYNIRFEKINSAPANYKSRDDGYNGVGVTGYNKSYTKEELLAAGVIDEFGNLIGGSESMAQYVKDCMIDAYTNADGASGSYPVPSIFLIDSHYKWINTPKLLASNKIGGISILYDNAYYINLGLQRREESDLAVKKDVEKVTLEINGQTHTYTYDTLENKENAENQWDISVRLSDAYYNTNYSRELYKADYIYKASMYGDKDENNDGIGDLFGKSKSDELEVYVTYKIMVRNQAMSIQSRVDELVDYYDQDLEYIDNRSYIEIKRGENQGKYAVKASSTSRYEQLSSRTRTTIDGYDNLYVTGLDDKYLTAGQTAYVYLTFRVKKDTIDGEDWVRLDEDLVSGEKKGVGKENIVEINGYSTRYAPGTQVPNIGDVSLEPAGIIDRDSNPGNLNPADVPKDRTINYQNFEDDTDKAPNMRIILYRNDDATRVISGSVWEDERNETIELTTTGDGKKKNEETLINGVTIQLVEVMENGTEYVWREFGNKGYSFEDFKKLPEEQQKQGLGGTNTIGKGTGSGTVSSETPIINYRDLIANYEFNEIHNGEYAFKSFMPGKYVVRFIYGDTIRTVVPNSLGGLNEKSYNGQDYKSTTYQEGIDQTTKYVWREKSTWNVGQEILGKVLTEVLAYDKTNSDHNERVTVPTLDANNNLDASKQKGYYYNITESDKKTDVSDAKDIESRRNEVINYSNVGVTNYIAEVLASHKADYDTMNDRNTLLKDLMANTSMKAETGLMIVELEYDQVGTNGNKKDNTYQITNVNLGLEERPKAQLAINKEVINVKLTLADGSVLFDAKDTAQNVLWRRHEIYQTGYNSKTHMLDESKFKDLENIRQLNKNKIGLIQLSMDEELMHGATIKVTYKITVTNVGEVDYKDNCFYYTGNVKDKNTIVKTKADQVIDYVANNLQFNASENSNWSVIEKDKLNTNNMYTTLVNNNLRKQVEQYNTIIQTEALNKELVPTLVSKENDHTEVPLVLTQLITSENDSDDLTYSNIVEIVKTSNSVGRRNEYSVVGNQDPTKEPQELDSDKAEVVKILPPFGDTLNYIVIAIIAVTTIGITTLAIIFIKKKVLIK